MSIIFYHNEQQKNLALQSLQRQEIKQNTKVMTQLLPFKEFYLAEDYHQKYYLRNETGLFKELNSIYPTTSQLINSTAAARINGFAGGHGTLESLQKQIDYLGLSEDGKKTLLKIGQQLLPQ